MSLESEVIRLFKSVPSNLNIDEYNVISEASLNSGEGFLGDIGFVSLRNKNSGQKELNLVVKRIKPSKTLRETTPVLKLFKNEVFIYTKVYPEFKLLEEGKDVSDGFTAIPKYYGSLITDTSEMMLLENMAVYGYKMYPPKEPLTIAHTKLALEQVAKWHAYSFILRKDKPDIFGKLTKSMKNLYSEFIRSSGAFYLMKTVLNDCVDLLRQDGVVSTRGLQKFQDLIEKFPYIFDDMYLEDPEYSVITHGDCWNNNFLFRNEKTVDGIEIVKDVCLLDWQYSTKCSPVFDVSFLLFLTSSKENYDCMNDLLEYYYDVLSSLIRKLGGDPEELYSHSKFQEHWRKFSSFGFMIAPAIIKYCHSKPPEVNPEEEEDEMAMFKTDPFVPDENMEAFVKRLRDLVIYYTSSI